MCYESVTKVWLTSHRALFQDILNIFGRNNNSLKFTKMVQPTTIYKSNSVFLAQWFQPFWARGTLFVVMKFGGTPEF